MATRTSNFDLWKPDGSDDFEDFRQEFNENMDTIDENLGGGGGSSSLAGLSDVDLTTPTDGQVLTYDGNNSKWVNANGGSGGHTIIDENGSTMPTEGKLQFTGNVSVSDDNVNGKTIVDILGGGGGGGAVYMGAELLWEGSFSGAGTIDVPNLDQYLVIAVQNDVSVLVIGNQFTGSGALGLYNQANAYSYAYRFNNAVTNKLTIDQNNRGIMYNGNTTYAGGSWCTITKIYGLVKKTGANEYYDFAIDPNNKLFEGEITNFNQQMEYTATEDAIVLCWYYGNTGYQHLYINGEAILIRGSSANSDVSFAVPIRRGDVVASRYLSASQSCFFRMVVYGIRQGTKVLTQNYTEDEQVVGTWMGKPLYQKTIPFSGINTYANTWYAFDISSYLDNPEIVFNISDMDYYFVSGVQRMFSNTSYEPPNMLLQTNVNRTNISGHVTVRYTKTTD